MSDQSDESETQITEVKRFQAGMGKKYAPMLGYDVPDPSTGVILTLMSDGTVRWEDLPKPGR